MVQSKGKRKLLTLNTHSWVEENSQEKLMILAQTIAKEKYSAIALQEVNQSQESEIVPSDSKLLEGYIPSNQLPPIKTDNFALALVSELKKLGLSYFWSWAPAHMGYYTYEEGLAILSLEPIDELETSFVCNVKSFDGFGRSTIGIRRDDTWFYSVHFTRWEENLDSFEYQWGEFSNLIDKHKDKKIYVMGDFNCPAHIEGKGYALMLKNEVFKDTYLLAEEKIGSNTTPGVIDGWRDTGETSMRIDYIITNHTPKVICSEVIFDGNKYPVVSDHFGVAICEEI